MRNDSRQRLRASVFNAASLPVRPFTASFMDLLEPVACFHPAAGVGARHPPPPPVDESRGGWTKT